MELSTLDSAVATIEEAIVTIVREATLPSLQERLTAEAAVAVERAGYGVLRALDEDGPMSLTTLARVLGLDNSTVSRHVGALERDGLVRKSEDPADRRSALLALTAAGRRALGRLRAVRHRVFAEVLSGWTAEDRDTLAPLLARLAEDFVTYGARA